MEELFKLSEKDFQDMDVEPWLEQKPEALRPIARKWIDAIMNCGSDVQEVFHDGCPVACIENTRLPTLMYLRLMSILGSFMELIYMMKRICWKDLENGCDT